MPTDVEILQLLLDGMLTVGTNVTHDYSTATFDDLLSDPMIISTYPAILTVLAEEHGRVEIVDTSEGLSQIIQGEEEIRIGAPAFGHELVNDHQIQTHRRVVVMMRRTDRIDGLPFGVHNVASLPEVAELIEESISTVLQEEVLERIADKMTLAISRDDECTRLMLVNIHFTILNFDGALSFTTFVVTVVQFDYHTIYLSI